MAAALVGGAFLSATFQVLFDRMASQEVVKLIRGRKFSATLVTKLKTWCLTLSKVLNDAEEKGITDTIVKEWVDELKDAVHHAEDLLDEIATEALRCQVEAEFGTSTSKKGACPKLKHMPEGGLPVSVSHIQIGDCPLLEKRLQRKKGKEWRNIAQHIVQSLNSPVRADEDNEDNLIDPEAVDELREIETRMFRKVYGERSLSLVAGSFFPSAKSEAGIGSWDWNETNPDSPLNISSIFPSTVSETDDSRPEFSRSNSNSIMSIFLPARSPEDSPENYEIIARSRSIPSYSIMSIFPPAMSEMDSPDYYETIFRNPSTPSYYHVFPPDMSETDSYGSSTPNHQLSSPSYYHFFPPDMSDTDSYGSSTPNHQLSIPPS